MSDHENLDVEPSDEDWASILLALASGTEAWLLDQVERGTSEWDAPVEEA